MPRWAVVRKPVAFVRVSPCSKWIVPLPFKAPGLLVAFQVGAF
jgi:hypothetical protein